MVIAVILICFFFIALAILVDQHLRDKAQHGMSGMGSFTLRRLRLQRATSPPPSAFASPSLDLVPEPMQLGSSRLCMYCARGDHDLRTCLLVLSKGHKSQVSLPSVHFNQFSVSATFYVANHAHVISVFLDSGSAVYLISHSLVSTLSLPVVKLANPISVNALDGHPLSDRPVTYLTHPLPLDLSP